MRQEGRDPGFEDGFEFFPGRDPVYGHRPVSDLIDIAILAFLIYHIFWFMRKTSSGRVLKGIMVLILTMGLASSIQLTATSWLLNRVVEWGILVLVILFQPEIRRALERMGSGKLASVFSSPAGPPRPTTWRALSARRWRPIPTCPGTRWAP